MSFLSLATNSTYRFATRSTPLINGLVSLVSSSTLKRHHVSGRRAMSTFLSAPYKIGTSTTNMMKKSNQATTLSLIQSNFPIQMQQSRTFASKKHKRIIKMAKGFRGKANSCFRTAINRVEKGLQYAYRDRKVKKREMRKLWIERINAGTRQYGLSYSRFINMINTGNKNPEKGEILLNRKVLSDLAASEPFSFKAVLDVVKMRSS